MKLSGRIKLALAVIVGLAVVYMYVKSKNLKSADFRSSAAQTREDTKIVSPEKVTEPVSNEKTQNPTSIDFSTLQKPTEKQQTTLTTEKSIETSTEKSTPARAKPKIDLFINIPAAGHLYIRRKVLRETWLSTVKKYPVEYRFFTDSIGIPDGIRQNVTKENETHKDLVFLPTRKGYWLTHRYLFAMFWGYQHYDFSFYLKTDDDYFVCLNNLVNDLQYRKQVKYLYWGHFGCEPRMIAMDEGFLILSIDLVEEIIKRNSSLMCHPFGGQMIAIWLHGFEKEGFDITYLPDNSRLMHYRSYLKKEHKDMCKELIGIHQAYPEHMARYWKITKDNWFSIKSEEFKKVEIQPYNSYCKLEKIWDWKVLNEFWRHEPKPCWQPGLRWREGLMKYSEVQSRELEEKKT